MGRTHFILINCSVVSSSPKFSSVLVNVSKLLCGGGGGSPEL